MRTKYCDTQNTILELAVMFQNLKTLNNVCDV